MSDSHAAHASHAVESPFTDAEIAGFQKADLSAGRAVVVLMLSIFSFGVVLYTIVAISCMN